MENNRFYVYCHKRKTDGVCFYVGKGSGKRYKEKGKPLSEEHKKKIRQSMLGKNKK